jgi:anaerobic dimethyl sulfoxide reductase subunit B (iron-sulfur subunit)
MDRLKEGLTPICVLSCSMRALEFGPLADLIRKYGDLRRLEDMPKDSITTPAAVFKPAAGKTQVIPWDPQRALQLWQKRHPESGEALPDVFADLSDVTQVPTDIVGRNKLVLKAKDSAGLMYYTSDNE